MIDFKEFINSKIAVSCSSEKENIDFVNLCCSNGLKLDYPDYMDRFDKNKLWTVGSRFKDEIFNDNNDKSFLSEYKVVPASEFLEPQTTIEIFQSKQTVVCLKKQDGKVIARGVARCSKDDEFNFDYGAELALNRMIEDIKKREFLKPLNEACKSMSKAFAIASANISSINSAIKAASEERERLLKESLFKSNHIEGDAVDAIIPKIKTLKDGTKIIKKGSYEVGDVVVFKKDLIPVGCLRTAKITETSGVYLFRFGGIGWYSINRIKGKVIG